MKSIVNKTNAPVRVALPRGKALHLGPKKTGEIRDEDADYAGVKKLVDAGKVEIMDGGHQKHSRGDGSAPHQSTHGPGAHKGSLPQKKGGE